jgi:hypothetical protein
MLNPARGRKSTTEMAGQHRDRTVSHPVVFETPAAPTSNCAMGRFRSRARNQRLTTSRSMVSETSIEVSRVRSKAGGGAREPVVVVGGLAGEGLADAGMRQDEERFGALHGVGGLDGHVFGQQHVHGRRSFG